jgi:hypothetical protein
MSGVSIIETAIEHANKGLTIMTINEWMANANNTSNLVLIKLFGSNCTYDFNTNQVTIKWDTINPSSTSIIKYLHDRVEFYLIHQRMTVEGAILKSVLYVIETYFKKKAPFFIFEDTWRRINQSELFYDMLDKFNLLFVLAIEDTFQEDDWYAPIERGYKLTITNK